MKFVLTAIWTAIFEVFRAIALGIYRLSGWRVEGALPQTRKFVVIAAPHTSNWDLPLMLAVAVHFRVRLRWTGKASLFKRPFAWFMRLLGGIPIDRSKSNNVVAQMVEVFNEAEALAVAVPPEGTRAKVKYWKTGFYNIAHGADVPIALGFLDYEKKVGGIGAVLHPSGDYDADLEIIKGFYSGVRGKHDNRSDEPST